MRHPKIALSHTCLALAFAAACPLHADDSIRPISGAKSVLAIFTQSYSIAINGRDEDQLIFAAWDDGYVVWSEDAVKGGAPYRDGKIDPARLQSTLRKLATDGLLIDKSLAQPKFGPDAHTTIILAKSKDGELKMQSWHEMYESNDKVVATAAGLTGLDGHSRFEVLRKEPAEYLYYRLAWDELRVRAAALVPAESKPVNGQLKFREGKAYWMELPAAKP